MATPSVLLGILSNLYINTNTYASPTWSPVQLTGDCEVPIEWEEGDVKIRASAMAMVAKTMMKSGINVSLLASLADTNYTTILNALTSRNIVNFMALNGTNNTNGARGVMFDSQIFAGSESQNPGDVVWDKVTIKPTYSGNAPNTVLVTSGSPVFTAV